MEHFDPGPSSGLDRLAAIRADSEATDGKPNVPWTARSGTRRGCAASGASVLRSVGASGGGSLQRVEVALRALESIQHEQEQLAHHWRQRIERAEYEAELARGRYEAVDVANRLVSKELERRWNEALTSAQLVRREAEEHLRRMLRELSEIERQRVLRMSREVRRMWNAPTTTPRDRKRLLRGGLERGGLA